LNVQERRAIEEDIHGASAVIKVTEGFVHEQMKVMKEWLDLTPVTECPPGID
jgi:hypothetical protein